MQFLKRHLLPLLTLFALLLPAQALGASSAPEHPGEALVRAGKYKEARAAFYPDALAGDLGAQTLYLELVINYDLSSGWLRDPQLLASYKANAHDPEGMTNLGVLAAKGIGTPDSKPDYPGAFGWLEKAATLGQARAMSHLGWLYQEGQGLPQDFDRAKMWYERAASLGEPMSMFFLSTLYQSSLGVHEDPGRSAYWLIQGINAGMELFSYGEDLGILQSEELLVAGRLDLKLRLATAMLERCLKEAEGIRAADTLPQCPICRECLVFKTSLVTPACHLLRRGPLHFFCPECLDWATKFGHGHCPACFLGENTQNLMGVYFKNHPGTPEGALARAIADRNFPLAVGIQAEIFKLRGDTQEAVDRLEAQALQALEAEQVAIDRELEEPALLHAEAQRAEAQRAEAALTEIRGAAIAARERLLDAGNKHERREELSEEKDPL